MKTNHGPKLGKTVEEWRERTYSGDVSSLREEWERELPGVDFSSLPAIVRIMRVWAIIDAQNEQVARAFGFGRGELDVLASLRRHGPPFRLRPTELQRLCVVTSGAITGRIDRLADLGLVERLDSAVDRRVSEVHLTRRGVHLAEKLVREVFDNGTVQKAFKKFAPRERQTFEALLERLHTEIEREVFTDPD